MSVLFSLSCIKGKIKERGNKQLKKRGTERGNHLFFKEIVDMPLGPLLSDSLSVLWADDFSSFEDPHLSILRTVFDLAFESFSLLSQHTVSIFHRSLF